MKQPRAARAAPPPRRRRSPETARREILDAAEALIVKHGPESVTLQAVGRAAGVSHALVTHYFGTYTALASAVLERRRVSAREQARASLASPTFQPGAGALMDVLLTLWGDPAYVRLTAWAALRGAGRHGVLPTESGAMKFVIDGLLAQVVAATGVPATPELRAVFERGIAAVIGSVFGVALLRRPLADALGSSDAALQLEDVGAELRAMLRARVMELVRREVDGSRST